jgi:hypothetical protein
MADALKTRTEIVPAQTIVRSPRLLTGRETAALQKLLWTTPQFSVRLERKGGIAAHTQLVFSIPIPGELRTLYPAVYQVIFGTKTTDWEMAIARGFWASEFNGKSLKTFVPGVLHRAFKKSVQMWLEKHWGQGDEYKKRIPRENSEYLQHSETKTGPQLSHPAAALWAAKQFRDLPSRIARMRRRFRVEHTGSKTKELKREIEKLFPYDIYVSTLHKLRMSDITPWTVVDPLLRPRQIALTAIECGLLRRGYQINSKKASVRQYIELGNKLLADLARIPKRIS